jgi:hypothetical protein
MRLRPAICVRFCKSRDNSSGPVSLVHSLWWVLRRFSWRSSQSRARLFVTSTILLYPTNTIAATLGDLDGDSRVTSADYLLLQQHLGAQIQLSPAQLQAADANADGSLSAADLPALRDLLLERFAPAVRSSSPAHLSVASPTQQLELSFNKRFHDDGNLAAGIRLSEAGPDKHLGTEDDVSIPNSITAAPPQLSLNLDSSLPSGTYGLYATPPIADFQGRAMIPFVAKFLIPGDDPLRDSDFDGIPDPEEIATGTNPLLSDTDGDLADDLLERDSGTDPLDPWSLPEDFGGKKVILSRAISYANLPGNAANSIAPAGWTSVISSIITYANLTPDSASEYTPAGWVSVLSPIVSYANLPSDSNFSGTPAGWTTISSAAISYANRPVDSASANTPLGWTSINSPVVSYANLPDNSDANGTPAGWVSVISATISYSNLSPETLNPEASETVTVVSTVVSYENS